MTQYSDFEQRKRDHIALALMSENQATNQSGLDRLMLRHEAIPDIDFDAISLESTRLGRVVRVPFMVASMTAGHREGVRLNECFMQACDEMGWSMGVGSQRRELTDPKAQQEWRYLRQRYPKVSLYSNLGIAQIITASSSDIQRLVDHLNAEAFIVHCNPLQESIQPEGTPQFKGAYDAIARLVKTLSCPVIIKETGCGFSQKTLQRLSELGVSAVDVSGLGGTHWGRIEGHRASVESIQRSVSHTFSDWGIDTVRAVQWAVAYDNVFEVWGSGGVRHGLDAAKLLALGARTVAFAKPILEAAMISVDALIACMATLEYELRVAMFCTGSRVLSDLKECVLWKHHYMAP